MEEWGAGELERWHACSLFFSSLHPSIPPSLRFPIASALSFVVCFLGLSALFMSLDAFFIGIIQVLVYAGAVMVLFLFIIMLLDLRAEQRRKLNWIAFGGGFLVAFSLLVQI